MTCDQPVCNSNGQLTDDAFQKSCVTPTQMELCDVCLSLHPFTPFLQIRVFVTVKYVRDNGHFNWWVQTPDSRAFNWRFGGRLLSKPRIRHKKPL